jgi:hypothetical protein
MAILHGSANSRSHKAKDDLPHSCKVLWFEYIPVICVTNSKGSVTKFHYRIAIVPLNGALCQPGQGRRHIGKIFGQRVLECLGMAIEQD